MTPIFPAFHPSLAGRITPAVEAEFSKLYLQFEGKLKLTDEETGRRSREEFESVVQRRLQVLKMRDEGQSYEKIAKFFGASDATIRKDYMVATSARRKSQPHIAARRQRVVDLVNSGMTVRDAAKVLGITTSTASCDLSIARHMERVA